MTRTDALVATVVGTTDPERLGELSHHRYAAVRQAVAENPATPRAVLEQLVRDRDHRPRFGVTDNPGPHAVEVALAAERTDVREVLCQRLDLPDWAYERLFADPQPQVRRALATSTDRPDLLRRLASDQDDSVRSEVSINDACPPEILDRLSRDPSRRVRSAVAWSNQLTEPMVHRLVRDKSVGVRWNLMHAHPHRLDIITLLLDDPDELNASAARHYVEDGRG